MRLSGNSLRRRVGWWLVLSALHLGLVVSGGAELSRGDVPSIIAAYLLGLMVALCWKGETGTGSESRVKIGKFGGLTGTLDDIV